MHSFQSFMGFNISPNVRITNLCQTSIHGNDKARPHMTVYLSTLKLKDLKMFST